MQVINNERIVPCDIDDTLVMHEAPMACEKQVTIEDPFEPGKFIMLGINQNMVKILKDEKARGAFILVWSRNGKAWAETIIKALNLESQVDMIMAKPLVYLDDSDVSNWLKDRVYIKHNVTYKKHLT